MSDNSSLVSEFMDVTGVDHQRAQFYLQSARWELHTALSMFYDDDGESIKDEGDLPEPVSSEPAKQTRGVPNSSSTSKPSSSKFGNIAQFQHEDDSSDSEEEGQAFYAGGSETSGQQILGPGKKKSKNPTQALFEAAKQQGAQVVDTSEQTERRKKAPPIFQGMGFKLGSDVQPSQNVGMPLSKGASPDGRDVAIKFWKNGFSVDDGSLRDFNDPANKEFLDAVGRGEVPPELQKLARGGEIHVTMEDKREEEYVKPKARVQAFAGKGHLLGSPSPTVVQPKSLQSEVVRHDLSRSSFKVDETQPVTTIQIRLADGTRLVSQFNHSMTVEDIRNLVRNAQPNTDDNFNLMTTFPNRVLTDRSKTISEENLLNAVIVQRKI